MRDIAEYNECEAYEKVSQNKPVFGVEYCDATEDYEGTNMVSHPLEVRLTTESEEDNSLSSGVATFDHHMIVSIVGP